MIPLLLFLSTFALYLASLAPSITVGDSGELCAASAVLGLAHSPGYPLYCLLGKIAGSLLPWGSMAYRVNLLSAACGAATVGILSTVLVSLQKNEGDRGVSPAVPAAVLLFAVSPAFWHSAVQAEVFTLNALFAAAILAAWAKDRELLSVFLFGLGLGNHHTLVFLGPLLAWSFFRDRSRLLRRAALALVFFATGFSIYLYLPIRSFKDPALDWGNPETLHNLWRVISRADYGTMALTTGEKIARDFATQGQQLVRYFAALNRQFTPVGLIAGAAGWLLIIRKKNAAGMALLITWCIIGPGFMLLANMPFTPETTGILERFYVLSNLFWLFPVATALRAVLNGRNGKAWGAVGIAAVVFVALARSPEASWRNYYLAYDYGRNLLRTLAPGSIFFMDGGDDTFYSTAYLQFAEKRRQDVELHDRGGLVFRNIYGPDFRRLTREEKDVRRQAIERNYLPERPVYYSTFNRQALPGVEFFPDGVLYRAAKTGRQNAMWIYALRSVFTPEYYDYRSRALVPVYTYFGALRDGADRISWWDYTLSRWNDAQWLRNNLHVELTQEAFREFSAGRMDIAERLYEKILSLFPDDAGTMVNFGVVQEKRGNRQKAKEYYTRAVATDPRGTDGYYNLAVVNWQEGNWQEVVRCFGQLLQVNPQDARARYYLPLAQKRMTEAQRSK